MPYIKTPAEIQLLIDGGRILGEILEKVGALVKPGITTKDLDQVAEELIVAAGGRPAFKGYRSHPDDPKYPATLCTSINEEVVHGIPSKKRFLQEGDIIGLDIGMQWPLNCGVGTRGNGMFTDTAITVPVGKINKEVEKFIEVTQKSLEKGIAEARAGKAISGIGKMVEAYVAPYRYGIVEDLVGHGVGHAVHEDPRVPNYYDPELNSWKMEPGLVIAIEPMLTMGKHAVKVAKDEWTILTKDKSLSAHFEHTVVITAEGPVVVTRRPSEL